MKSYLFSHPLKKGIQVVLLLAIVLLNFGSSGTGIAYAAPPLHDDFNGAELIDSIEYHDTVITTEATPNNTVPNSVVGDPDNFLCEDETGSKNNTRAGFTSIWYQYTPPEKQGLSLNANGKYINSNIAIDLYIAVWTGTEGNLELVACNDETFAGYPELSFEASAGVTYYIEIAQIDGQGSSPTFGGNVVFNAFITNTNVSIGGTIRGRYFIPETGGLRRSFINLSSGPVEIENVAGNQLIAAERVIYNVNGINTSFSEMMGLPDSQLNNVYWLPWYNNKTLNTQLRFGNVSNTNAIIHVTIGGVEMVGSPYTLAPGDSIRRSYTGIDKGPVKIQSNVNIVAAERVIYSVNGANTSFTEMMAFPESQLDRFYWMPWYNNKDLDSQLRIANVSPTTATVRVFIGGIQMPGSPFTLTPGASKRISYPGVDRGPVRVASSVNIVAAERVIYKINGVPVSFSEMMGIPNKQLDTTYWLPWYNSRSLNTQLRIANVSASTAQVSVFIGGQLMSGTPFTLLAGQSKRLTFPNIDRGPVRIQSTQNIVAAERVIYKVNNVPTSFSEMMGMPNSLLDTRYWMPWYNNVDLNTQLRFALP